MPKKIVPVMRYEVDTGGLKLDIGARTFGVFEGYDDLGQPFSLDGLADHIGPMIEEAFNALPEAVRIQAREPIDQRKRKT